MTPLTLLVQPHAHRWFASYRQGSPRADIYDCACGLRRKVFPGMDGQPEIVEVEPASGGSINNCLDTLGDPQADRLRLMIAEQEKRHG